jgi:hypothetical protein
MDTLILGHVDNRYLIFGHTDNRKHGRFDADTLKLGYMDTWLLGQRYA